MKAKANVGSSRKTPVKKKAGQKKQKGVAAVEFAIVLPILLLLIFGIVELSIGLYDKAVITNASREGARVGIVLKNPKATTADITAAVTTYTSNYLLTFANQAAPTVNVVQSPTSGFGTPLSVSVSYVYRGLGLGQMLSALTGPITLSATTVMNNE